MRHETDTYIITHTHHEEEKWRYFLLSPTFEVLSAKKNLLGTEKKKKRDVTPVCVTVSSESKIKNVCVCVLYFKHTNIILQKASLSLSLFSFFY